MALPQIAVLTTLQGAGSGRFFIVGSAITSVLWIALGFLIYRRSEALALRMFPNGEPFPVSTEPHRILEVGFALLAVYLGIDAIGRVSGLLYTMSQWDSWQSESRVQYVWDVKKEGLLAASVELIACVALFLGRRGLAGVARAVRSMPEPPSN
jgi:hypothetical protein